MVGFTAGLLAKPMVVTLPVVLLLLDVWPLGRLGPRPSWSVAGRLALEKIPLLAVAAGLSVVTMVVQHSVGAVISIEDLPVGPRLANAAVSYVRYLGEILWPAR